MFLAALILPPVIGFGFDFWSKQNVIQSPCPNCGQVAAGLKNQGFTQCFSCGAQLSLRGEEWKLRSKYEDDPRDGGGSGGRGGGDSNVIDVDASEVIDV